MTDEPTYAGLVAKMDTLARAMHAEGRQATASRRSVEGTTLRVAANLIRERLDLDPIPYDGPEGES